MRPVVFGTADRPLIGLHHAPVGTEHRAAGVVLCHPAPQEYQLTHWAFRKLASLLARDGFDVLRFDYGGTGDSAGDLSSASLQGWCDDVSAAVTELRDVSGVERTALVGFRLGAGIAARAARDSGAGALVLWEPVVHGRRWLAESRRVEERYFCELCVQSPPPGSGELFGYALPPSLAAEIAAFDLPAALPSGTPIVLAVSEERPETAALAARLQEAARSGGAPVSYRRVQQDKAEESDGAFLSTGILAAIGEELAEILQ